MNTAEPHSTVSTCSANKVLQPNNPPCQGTRRSSCSPLNCGLQFCTSLCNYSNKRWALYPLDTVKAGSLRPWVAPCSQGRPPSGLLLAESVCDSETVAELFCAELGVVCVAPLNQGRASSLTSGVSEK